VRSLTVAFQVFDPVGLRFFSCHEPQSHPTAAKTSAVGQGLGREVCELFARLGLRRPTRYAVPLGYTRWNSPSICQAPGLAKLGQIAGLGFADYWVIFVIGYTNLRYM
jgi:hypothetical protein